MNNFRLKFLKTSITTIALLVGVQFGAFAQDTEAPVFTDCPNDIYVSILSQCDTVVNWIAPVAVTDNSTAPLSPIVQTAGPSIGDALTPGNHTVTYEVSDSTGNTGYCNFVIHVYGVAPAGLACNVVNISMDENCMVVLDPRMVLQDTASVDCIDNYVVFILDELLNPITDTLTHEHVGNTYMYMVSLPNSGLSCMNQMTVEDKLPPILVCVNDTVGCHELDAAVLPTAIDACTATTLIKLSEVQEPLNCDSNFIARVTRTYYAKDEYNNFSDTCTQVIMLRRVDLSGIVYPINRSLFSGNPLSCSGVYPLDDNGNPSPNYVGVPKIGGVSIFPTPGFLCNSSVRYEDQVTINNSCLKRIIRRWMTTEWWCSDDFETVGFQTIDIVDNIAPIISCPDDMSFSTSGHDCSATVNLPALTVTDNCNTVPYVSVTVDGLTRIGNGGVFDIPVGNNVVTYIAADACGNRDTCSFNVTVADHRKPVVICLQNTVTSLTYLGTSYITADMVDNGSFDDCKLDRIEIRRMDDLCGVSGNTEFGDKVYFCCEDLGADVMVVLRATDVSGNYNECMVSVQVQNKIVPTIASCPSPIVNIFCTDYYNPDDLAASFGTITVSTLCSDNYTIEETAVYDLTACNIGYIDRTIELKSLSGQVLGVCYQNIKISNSSPFDGNTEISWPDDYEDDNLCSMDGLSPLLLDAPYNLPVYSDDVCTLLGESYEDDVFEFVNGEAACFKIIRHWSIIDWCQTNFDGTYKVWRHDQILKITNSIAPTFSTACTDQSICTYDVGCAGGEVVLHKDATDDCTSPEGLKWSYKIDLNNDNAYDLTGSTNDATADYGLGTHRIVWTVRDGCGKYSTCTEIFEVKNCKAPIPIAHHGLSSTLVAMDTDNDGEPDTEMVMLDASFFDKGSYSPCGYSVQVSFSADVYDNVKVFGCAELGEQVIELWVTDILGNQAHVITYVIIEDHNDVDICPSSLTFDISGRIVTEEFFPISDVQVKKMITENESEETTGEEGVFIFSHVGQGLDVMIEPGKDIRYDEGVSTLDLLLIQRHVLRLKNLNSPYKLLAADINGDNQVNGSDIIMLRRLILGKIKSFEGNDSWNFIDARFQFDDPESPWDEEYLEYRMIEYLYGDKIADFIGVKIGDINNSVSDSFKSKSDQDRNIVNIEVEDRMVKANEIVKIPMRINDENMVKGFQFALAMDNLKFIGINSAITSLGNSNTNIDKNNKQLICSWNDINYTGTELAFVLEFEAKKDGKISDMIVFNQRKTNAEVYMGEELTSTDLNLDFNWKETPNITEEVVEEVLSNHPNPFSDDTEIRFSLNKDQDATISFYDVTGKLLLEHTSAYYKGQNTYLFEGANYNLSGILYVKLKTSDNTITRKMIITK